jgi:glyoxylase-like metal-dependent hydrolase (beta-lactamase superfamily II)
MTPIKDGGPTLDWIIETHVHADHRSAARDLQQAVASP